MRRPSFSILMVAFFSLFIVACGGGATQQPTAPPVATQPQGVEETEPPATGGYQGGAVTDGGTIVGKITYSGAPVEPEVVEVDKDTEVCGTSLEVAKVQTDEAGGLANAVVRITDIASGKPLDSLGSEFVLDQMGCEYVPAVVIVPVGAALTVLNSDGILHNIHTTPFDNPPLNVAQPATQPEIMSDVFSIPEIIPVGCDVHKWMNAHIVVVDQPYAAVTGSDGSFALSDVPPGAYTVEIWHAELGTQTATVTVEAGAEAPVEVDFP